MSMAAFKHDEPNPEERGDLVDRIVDKRNKILEICAKYGAGNVRIFGSCATDDYNESSDVDILVDFKGKFDFFALLDLKDELEKLMGCAVDVCTEAMLRSPIRESALKEAVPL